MPSTTPRDVPRREGYGSGSYRRRIVVDAQPGRARGELADDFHHFAVTIEHDGRSVTAIDGEGIRVPWTTCRGAAEPLERVVGAPIRRSLAQVARYTDPRAQCTHWYDVACLAVAHAARRQAGGAATRRYDLVLPDRREGVTEPTLDRDGERLIEWRLAGLRITRARPQVFAGVTMSGPSWSDFMKAASGGGGDDDFAEAAAVMRRGVFIGLGRQYDFESITHAASFAPVVGAACHTFSDAHRDEARKLPGTVRDFHAAPERILDR